MDVWSSISDGFSSMGRYFTDGNGASAILGAGMGLLSGQSLGEVGKQLAYDSMNVYANIAAGDKAESDLKKQAEIQRQLLAEQAANSKQETQDKLNADLARIQAEYDTAMALKQYDAAQAALQQQMYVASGQREADNKTRTLVICLAGAYLLLGRKKRW